MGFKTDVFIGVAVCKLAECDFQYCKVILKVILVKPQKKDTYIDLYLKSPRHPVSVGL